MGKAQAAALLSGESGKGLTYTEWYVLRACHRLGAPALTGRIVREVQEETLRDYRHIQVLLLRLRDRGFLKMEKLSPKRALWSLAVPYREVLREEIRLFISRALGPEGADADLVYEVLAEVEAADESAGEAGALPGKLRVRLIDCLRPVVENRSLRNPLAETLGVSLRILDGLPTSAQTILLIKAAGGYTVRAAGRILDETEALEGALDSKLRERIAGMREDLGAGG